VPPPFGPEAFRTGLLAWHSWAAEAVTHRGRRLPTAAVAALPPRSGGPKNSTYFPLTPESFTDFDRLAVLDTTGYPRGGPPLP